MLYAEGGVRRFYQGLPWALLQTPLTRFGDTAANSGVLLLLSSTGFGQVRLPLTLTPTPTLLTLIIRLTCPLRARARVRVGVLLLLSSTCIGQAMPPRA